MKLLPILAALLFGAPAFAQSVQQSGSVTPGHVASWTTTGVIQDGGSSGNGKLKEVGITNTGTPSCINDAVTTGPYHQLCFGALSLGGGLISYSALNGASALPFQFNINGTTWNPLDPILPGDITITGNLTLSGANSILTAPTYYSNRVNKSDYSGGATTTSNESLKMLITNPTGLFDTSAGNGQPTLSQYLISEQSSSLTAGLRITPNTAAPIFGLQVTDLCCSLGSTGRRIGGQFAATLNQPSGNSMAVTSATDDLGIGITNQIMPLKTTGLGSANDGGTDLGPLASGVVYGLGVTSVLSNDAKNWTFINGIEVDWGARTARNETGGSVKAPTYGNGRGLALYTQFGNVPPTYDAASNPNPQLAGIEISSSFANAAALGAARPWGVDCGLCFGGVNPVNATGLAQDPGRLFGSMTHKSLLGIEPYSTLTGIDLIAWNFADFGGTALAGQAYRSPGFSVSGAGAVTSDTYTAGAAGTVARDTTTGLTLTGTKRYTVTAATVDAPGDSYYPGQVATYCTGSPCLQPIGAPSFLVTESLATAVRRVVQTGSGGVDGACTLTGTTGAPTPATFSATISGGIISGTPTINTAGTYSTAPDNANHELVDGSSCGLNDTLDAANPPVVTGSGSGYVIGETITLSGGSSTTAATMVVSQLTVVGMSIANAGTTPGTPNATCTISGSQVSSTSDNQTWFANVTLDSGGLVSTINSFTGGVYIATPTSPNAVNAPLISGSPCGALAGATFTLTMGVYNATVGNAGTYQGPFLGTFTQASSTGSGTGATFKAGQWIGPELAVQFGAKTLQVISGGNLASAPANPVNVYADGALNGLTVNLTTAQETGDVTVAPASGAVAKIVSAPLVISKLSGAPGAGPGAGLVAIFAVAGTNAGSCKIQAQAGTSATPVDIIDNIGSGC